MKRVLLCVKKGQGNECSVMHGSGYVSHGVCKVWGQRLQMGHNEWVRPEREISFLVLSIFVRNPSVLSPVQTTTILVITWWVNWRKVYLTSPSVQTKRRSIAINTEQRHKDKSVFFQLNHDNVVMYCSVLNDDKAIVSAFRFGSKCVFIYCVIFLPLSGLTVLSERAHSARSHTIYCMYFNMLF